MDKFFVPDKKYFVMDKSYFVLEKKYFVQADGQGISVLHDFLCLVGTELVSVSFVIGWSQCPLSFACWDGTQFGWS